MTLKTYDARQVTIGLGAALISGFATGTFVTVERNADTWTPYIGADGEQTRARSNDRSGKITIRLAQSSDSNALLASQAFADEFSGVGVTPVIVKDNSGTTICTSAKAYIQKPATVEFGKETSEREWVLQCDNLVMGVGGNAVS